MILPRRLGAGIVLPMANLRLLADGYAGIARKSQASAQRPVFHNGTRVLKYSWQQDHCNPPQHQKRLNQNRFKNQHQKRLNNNNRFKNQHQKRLNNNNNRFKKLLKSCLQQLIGHSEWKVFTY